MRTTSTRGVEHTAELLRRRWLSPKAFELELTRPHAFEYSSGQRIRLVHEGTVRDYSLISTPHDPALALCVRKVDGGALSPLLASAEIGRSFHFTGPHGYFTFRSSPRPPVFVATGIGIAPFVAMARSGIRNATLFYGVREPDELYYESLFRSVAWRYVPCLSGVPSTMQIPHASFRGRVTEYLKKHLRPDAYDFYLCGRSEMARDATFLIDELFTGSFVYTEIFY